MAASRACLLVVALLSFFFLGAPLQWLVARRAPRFAHRIPLVFCRTLLAITRVEVVVTGVRVEDRPVLLVSNHVSWIDILAFGAITPFCFVAKGEVGSWPILSAFAEVQGTVFLDRKRRRTIPASNRKMAARMLQGRPVLLFPEGTTIGKPSPGPFFTSHFAATRDVLAEAPDLGTVAVQPVAICYSSDDAAWVGDENLVSHLWRTLRAPPLRCVVSFGPAIDVEADADRKLVARHAREAIVRMIEMEAPAALAQTIPVAASDVGPSPVSL